MFLFYVFSGVLNSSLVQSQVRLEGTNWSFPVEIVKEDTITLVLRRQDGSQTFLRTEIRGYEEGSRFITVFRLGSISGPIRYFYLYVHVFHICRCTICV